MFRHPNYYKKLRASLKKEAISPDDTSTDGQGRTPKVSSTKLQAPSTKRQAFEPTRSIAKRQASQPE